MLIYLITFNCVCLTLFLMPRVRGLIFTWKIWSFQILFVILRTPNKGWYGKIRYNTWTGASCKVCESDGAPHPYSNPAFSRSEKRMFLWRYTRGASDCESYRVATSELGERGRADTRHHRAAKSKVLHQRRELEACTATVFTDAWRLLSLKKE